MKVIAIEVIETVESRKSQRLGNWNWKQLKLRTIKGRNNRRGKVWKVRTIDGKNNWR